MREWSEIWWDAKQALLAVPRLARSLFERPSEEGIQTPGDLVYEFGQALLHIPDLFRRLAFKTRTLDEELHEAMLRGTLRKAFSGFDLLMLGLGIVIGTGAFTLTGQAQAQYAGSAILISYFVTAVSCLCAAACYAELCVEYPVSGSAFTYVMATFGELPAFVTMGMLLVEYLLGMAAVARGFSQYLAQLVNQPGTLFTLNDSPGDSGSPIDLMAFGIVVILTIALSFGVRESSLFLSTLTILKLFLILFVAIAGFTKANGDYFTDNFGLPGKGPDGVFQGAAFIFFAYVGFDAICNAVEETRRPVRIPAALLGTVGVSAVVYMFLSLSLSFIATPDLLNGCYDSSAQSSCPSPLPSACATQCSSGIDCSCGPGYSPAYTQAFAVAFNCAGLSWMRYIVAIAALLGITTSLLVGLYSVARLVMVASRNWLLPPFLSRISPRTQTPLFAQLLLGAIIAVVALFVSFNFLSQMVSFGTLFALWMVVNTFLFRRYYPEVKLRYTQYGEVQGALSKALWRVPGAALPRHIRRILVWVHIVLINAVCVAFVIHYRVTLHVDSGTPCVDTVANVQLQEYKPSTWAVPSWALPWLPTFAILLIMFSLSSLQVNAFWIMAIYFVGLIVVYIFFSMPLSYIKHYMLGADSAEQLNVVELVYRNGKWMSYDQLTSTTASGAVELSGLSALHKSYFGASYSKTAPTEVPLGDVKAAGGSPRRAVAFPPNQWYGSTSSTTDDRSTRSSTGGDSDGMPQRGPSFRTRHSEQMSSLPALQVEREGPEA